MMSEQDYLMTVAQIAIAIAGFSSIVEALSTRHMQYWADAERYNYRILLQVSAMALFFALLPMILVQLWNESVTWRVAVFVYGVFHLADIGSFVLKLPSGTPGFVKITITIGLTIACSQVYIAIVNQENLMIFIYLVALAWQLFIAFLGFAMLLYGSRPKAEDD
jgi:hypothetical protein